MPSRGGPRVTHKKEDEFPTFTLYCSYCNTLLQRLKCGFCGTENRVPYELEMELYLLSNGMSPMNDLADMAIERGYEQTEVSPRG